MPDPDYFDYKSAWLEMSQWLENERRRAVLCMTPFMSRRHRAEAKKWAGLEAADKQRRSIQKRFQDRADAETRTREIVAEMMKEGR